MKKFALIVSFLFPICLLAQEAKPVEESADKKNKHELGVNLFSITNVGIQKYFEGNTQQTDIYYFTNYSIPSGFYYKMHSGKNALRLSYDYFQRSYSSKANVNLSNIIIDFPPYEYSYDYNYYGTKKEHEFKIGYQRSFGKKRFTGFFSTDLLFNYNKFIGAQTFYWYPSGTTLTSPFYYEQYNAGIALGGGLKYKITKRLSLTYEFSVAGIYARRKNLIYKNSDWSTEQSLKINPVRMIGFGYSF